MLTILGPTATGKTRIAAGVALRIGAEIISADSRQVFKRMDIGTGKDIEDYTYNGVRIPYHLLDIAEPGSEFSVFDFLEHFYNAYNNISSRSKQVILCGGTGLYLEAALKGYKLPKVPINEELRSSLALLSNEQLIERLKSFKEIHNTTDSVDLDRLVRAIEIQTYLKTYTPKKTIEIPGIVIGIKFERSTIRQRITNRLKQRLDNGMVEEVKQLIDEGVSVEMLGFYGLEYRYISHYLIGNITYNQLFESLNTAIHQFAKRQTTWFRRMEKNGTVIHWIDGYKPEDEKIELIASMYKDHSLHDTKP
jgi:tRNA dimethylallyltransferase